MQVITTDSLEALRDKCRSNPEIVNKNFSDLQDELGLQMVDFNGQVDYESLPSLQLPQGKTQSTNNDSANIKIISRALESLSAAEGTDERFWVTLCFDRYAEYTRARWKFDNFTGKVEVDSKKHKNHVKNHWFAKNSRNRMRDNAVSRLWWMGHIANRVPDMEIDEVLEVYEVMGASSYFVKIAAENNEDAQSIIKKIGDIDRVSHSESFLVLKELKHQSSRIPVSTIDKPDRKPRKVYD